MSSASQVGQEAQASTPCVTESQVSVSPINGPPTGSPNSVATSSSSVSTASGSVAEVLITTTSVSALVTPAANQPVPRGVQNGTLNEPLQEHFCAKFLTSPGFVVSAPSVSYSILPLANSSSGSMQQSSSTPVSRLTPPVSAAALQPPVPGQACGNRPSFSYSIASQANAGPATGQQFQPAIGTNSGHLQGGKFIPTMTAASLQPPVPGQSMRPSLSVPGSISPYISPQIRFPPSVTKGHILTLPSSFSGSSQPSTTGASENSISSNQSSFETAIQEAGSCRPTSSSQPAQSLVVVPSSSAMSSAATASMHPSSMVMLRTSSFAVQSGMSGVAGIRGQKGIPNSASFSLNSPGGPSNMGSSPSLVPVMPFAVSAPSNAPNPIPQNVQQQVYPSYASLPAMAPPAQVPWSHPSQHGGLHHSPILPFPGVFPTAFSQLIQGTPLQSVSVQTVQTPGVSTAVSQGGTIPVDTLSSNLGCNLNAESSHEGHDKQSADLSKNGSNPKNEELGVWTAHKTENGVIYYYNSLTGQSTYEKPLDFKGKPEKVNDQPTPVSWEKLDGTDWTSVTTNDGKKYYYNSKNKVSSWQLPAEVAELRKNQDIDPSKENSYQMQNVNCTEDKGSVSMSLSAPALQTGGRDSTVLRTSAALVSSSALDLIKKKLQDAGSPAASSPVPTSSTSTASDLNGSRVVDAAAKGLQSTNSKDKVKDANCDSNMSDSLSDSDDADMEPSKKDCIIQFKEMLKERGVAPFSKWDKELPKIVFDPRFKAVPGYSTRRALFEQFVRTRAEEVRKEERAAQKAAIDGFKQLLEEASEDIDHRTDYEAFKKKWGSDPRFVALKRKDQELLLNEKILPLKKAAEEKIQAIRMTVVSSFKLMLHEKDVSLNSRWSRVKDSLRNDPRYKAVKHEEREILFNEYISELKAAEAELEQAAKAKKDEQEKLKERERELRKRKEREEQEMERVKLKIRKKEAVASYQALLVETVKDPKASWTDSKPKLERDPQSRAANPDLGQTDAEKLFREHVKDLYERCACDFRSLLAEVITPEAVSQATEDGKTVLSSWSEAKRLLKLDPRYSKMPRKERESLWSRYAEDMMWKQKMASLDPKEKREAGGRNKSPADYLKRSPRRPADRR